MQSGHSLEDLFEIERETHLKALLEGISSLRTGKSTILIKEKMFRSAHSLKGAARLVKNLEIENTSHKIEDLLKDLKSEDRIDLILLENLAELVQSLTGTNKFESDLSSERSFNKVYNPLLHINSQHIAELIQLASELAVITKKIDSEVGNKFQLSNIDNDNQQSNQYTQRAVAVATALQQLTYRLRLTPLHEITRGLPQIARDLASQLNKIINVRILNGNTLIDRDLLRKIEPCLIQLLKNSIDHGLEVTSDRIKAGKSEIGTISITAKQYGAVVEIEFKDDGDGIDPEIIRSKVVEKGLHDYHSADKLTLDELLEFLFLPGFSTRNEVNELSGRGIGLDIVRATLKELGGDVIIRSTQKVGTSFILRIPSRIASFRSLLFKCQECGLGVPLSFVDRIINSDEVNYEYVSGKAILHYESLNIPLVDARDVFKFGNKKELRGIRPIIVLSAGENKLALVVDNIEGEQEVVIHPLDSRYQRMQNILGMAGGVGEKFITIINPEQLLAEPLDKFYGSNQINNTEDKIHAPNKILIVDDSLTVRELERRILEQAGYQCTLAIDGIDGYERLQEDSFSLIVTDIDMPRLNGFELIERIRSEEKYRDIPIVVVSYKERQEDKARGLALGANSFLSKGSFKDDSFISTIRNLLANNKL